MRTDTIYHIDYWIKKGLTEDDANKKIEITKKETSWRCKEFWMKRGYTEEQSIMEISLKQSKISLKRDKSIKREDPYSKEYYFKKNIVDLEKINELIQKRKDKSNPYLKWTDQELISVIKKRKITFYSKEKEERNKINKSKGRNKKEIIEKFGEERALSISINRGKGSRSSYERKYSKISMELFNIISDINKDKTFNYGKNEKFILINSKNKRKGYFVDFYFDEKKKIIEFNGDYWHFNPKKYLSDSFITMMGIDIFAKDIWEQDEEKLNVLTELGYEILIIWENDFKENKENTISICNNFIKN